jgi:hypothetical protein
MARKLAPGMGEAVAKRTILRPGEDPTSLKDVGLRVAAGNTALHPTGANDADRLAWHIQNGSILMSGRSLEHGDSNQVNRQMEMFTNCSTAMMAHIGFYLLLNGSGVGSDYSDALRFIDWRAMPRVKVVLHSTHADFDGSWMTAAEVMKDKAYDRWLDVGDSKEGWAKAVEELETAAHSGTKRDEVWVIDFSLVREKDAPIKGLYGKPAPGPAPTMRAFVQLAHLRDLDWPCWKQALYADHYLASSVLAGGARRAARIAVKYWKDPDIFEFIRIKQDGDLWSANNSVAVDQEFWDLVNAGDEYANGIARAMTDASYRGNPTNGEYAGEPGWLNVHKLTTNKDGLLDAYLDDFIGSSFYQPNEGSINILKELFGRILLHAYQFIVNPCGEVSLFIMGGYCVVGDVVGAFCENPGQFFEALELTTRALMRVNLMPAMYHAEVNRTNRIGVSQLGMFELAWKWFGFTIYDLLDEEKSFPFWQLMSQGAMVVDQAAVAYAQEIGRVAPHTRRCIKPGGTTGKLFLVTEGAHLPAYWAMLRWVQHRNDAPEVQDLFSRGYPIQTLSSYPDTTIVGFPTRPLLSELMDDKLVTAGDLTIDQHYQWVRLLEKYWIQGQGFDGVTPQEETGNQVSYTAKFRYEDVSYDGFHKAVMANQESVRCISVMPQADALGFEYQPEEAITRDYYLELTSSIDQVAVEQGLDEDHLQCNSGACPI